MTYTLTKINITRFGAAEVKLRRPTLPTFMLVLELSRKGAAWLIAAFAERQD